MNNCISLGECSGGGYWWVTSSEQHNKIRVEEEGSGTDQMQRRERRFEGRTGEREKEILSVQPAEEISTGRGECMSCSHITLNL